MATKKKKKSLEFNITECKYCQHQLVTKELSWLPKKYIEEKLCFWGGIEKPYIQIVKIRCNSCQKQYSVRKKDSDWFYK